MRTFFLIVLSAVSGFSSAAPLDSLQVDALRDQAQDEMAELLEARSSAGLGVALIVDGKIAYQHAAGVKKKGHAEPFSADTSMAIAGVSRLLLGVLAETLRDRAQLDFNQPAGRILTSLKFSSRLKAEQIKPIILDDFLSYSTGISRGELKSLFSDREVAPFVLPSTLYLVRPAGAFGESSFLSDEVLAMVLSSALKLDYPALLKREVLEPLQLNSTHFGYQAGDALEHHEGKKRSLRHTRFRAALGASSSLADIAKLIAALDSDRYSLEVKRRLSAALPRKLEYDFSEPGTGQGSAFYFTESSRPAVGLVGYADSRFDGHTIAIRYLPKHRIGLVVMANASTDREGFSDFVNQQLDSALFAKTGIAKRNPKERIRKPKESLPLPAGFIATEVAAHYSTPMGIVTPQLDGDSFDFKLAGFGLRAYRRGDGWWQLRYRLLGLIPLNLSFIENILIAPVAHTRPNGDVQQLLLYAAGSDVGLFGSAIVANSQANDHGEAWIGEYQIDNPDEFSDAANVSDIDIVRVGGHLLLRATFDRFINIDFAIPLTAFSANDAKLAGFGPGLGEPITRDNAGRVNFAGYRLRKR